MEFPRDPSAGLSGRRERPHPTWIRTRSFQVWDGGSKHPKTPRLFPNLIPFLSETVLELCQECGHLGNARSWELPLEQGLGTFGNVDLGSFGKDAWFSLGKSIPRGPHWSRDGEETQGGLRLQLGFFRSNFGIGIYPNSALVPPGAGTIPGRSSGRGLVESGML